MEDYKIQIILPAPDREIAKRVANEAQALVDQFGYENFLNLADFIRTNPDMVRVGLSMITPKRF